MEIFTDLFASYILHNFCLIVINLFARSIHCVFFFFWHRSNILIQLVLLLLFAHSNVRNIRLNLLGYMVLFAAAPDAHIGVFFFFNFLFGVGLVGRCSLLTCNFYDFIFNRFQVRMCILLFAFVYMVNTVEFRYRSGFLAKKTQIWRSKLTDINGPTIVMKIV